MAFHVVSSFLLRVLASKTTLWMARIFQQPISCFCFMVFEANTYSKKEDTTWKAMKSWVRKCYISCVPLILRSLGHFERCEVFVILWRWEDRVISVIRKIHAWQLEEIFLHFQIHALWNIRVWNIRVSTQKMKINKGHEYLISNF